MITMVCNILDSNFSYYKLDRPIAVVKERGGTEKGTVMVEMRFMGSLLLREVPDWQ